VARARKKLAYYRSDSAYLADKGDVTAGAGHRQRVRANESCEVRNGIGSNHVIIG
jgi:hypothetical protein